MSERSLSTFASSHRLIACFGIVLGAVVMSTSVTAQNTDATIEIPEDTRDWRSQIWSLARDGELERIEMMFNDLPEDADLESLSELRSLLKARSEHLQDSSSSREDGRQDSLEEIELKLDEGNMSEALLAAVKMQEYSKNRDAVLDEVVVDRMIRNAEKAIDLETDLLFAQEILFRLRTLHDEEVNRPEKLSAYDEQLDQVNRRIALLARYSPRSLHEMRRTAAARLKLDEEFPEFNEEFAEDWKEQHRDITEPMLRSALRTTASEHITDSGWKPLLDGGLEAVDLFASTQGMDENFPNLADEKKVEKWKKMIQAERDALSARDARDVARSDYRRIMSKLLDENIETINVPERVLYREFGDGATYRLEDQYEDKYTQIIWPQRLRRFEQQVQGEFVGVGILIRHDDKREIVIDSPLEGSPASRGGVKENDHVVNVNGIPTTGWSLTRAVDEITGPRGEEVVLGIRRDGVEKTIDIPIVRDVIKIRSVNGWWKEDLQADGTPEWDWYIDKSAGVGYVRLTSFNDDSYLDFRRAVDEMRKDGELNGLILDLRYNPGGLLDSAVRFCNLFVEDGTIVSCQDRDKREVWTQPAQRQWADYVGLPLVILVNKGSASASEIVSGCLQAHEVAVVIGDRTFGKGSVQSLHDVADRMGQAALKLTTQYYALPPAEGELSGRLVHKVPGSNDWGVNPDISVEMDFTQYDKALALRRAADLIVTWKDEGEELEERPNPRQLLDEGIDPQLEMALLILKARLLEEGDANRIMSSKRP